MKKNVTINDIARFAGVSKATVSHYLNGHFEFMSGQTRAKIEKHISMHDYRPNSLARGLKSRKSGFVGVLLPSLEGPGTIKLLNGLHMIFAERHITPVFQVLEAGNPIEARKKCIQTCIDLRVDGMIVNMDDEDISPYIEVQDRGIPVVMTGGVRESWKYDAVYIDHYAAIRLALDKMAANGYQNIFFIGEEPGTIHMQGLRKKAYQDFIRLHGGVERAFTIHPKTGRVDSEMREIVGKILRDPSNAKAVIVDSSHTLKAFLGELKKHGTAIPEQLGVCGFDAWGWCHLIDPGITAFRSSSYELAREAARLLVERMESREERVYRRIIIDAVLIERESTRKL